MEEVPRKRARRAQEYFGVRIEPELKRELEDLSQAGVDVPELARMAIRGAVAKAKAELARKAEA